MNFIWFNSEIDDHDFTIMKMELNDINEYN
jgi:hypothetical protein